MTLEPEKLDAIVERIAKDNEEIKQFISTNKGKSIEVDAIGLKLLVPSTIPKKLRHELAAIQRKGDVSVEDAEKDTYHLLSLLCQNEPYNHAEAWEYIDNETGLAIDILGEVLEKAYDKEKKVQSFRGK